MTKDKMKICPICKEVLKKGKIKTVDGIEICEHHFVGVAK